MAHSIREATRAVEDDKNSRHERRIAEIGNSAASYMLPRRLASTPGNFFTRGRWVLEAAGAFLAGGGERLTDVKS